MRESPAVTLHSAQDALVVEQLLVVQDIFVLAHELSHLAVRHLPQHSRDSLVSEYIDWLSGTFERFDDDFVTDLADSDGAVSGELQALEQSGFTVKIKVEAPGPTTKTTARDAWMSLSADPTFCNELLADNMAYVALSSVFALDEELSGMFLASGLASAGAALALGNLSALRWIDEAIAVDPSRHSWEHAARSGFWAAKFRCKALEIGSWALLRRVDVKGAYAKLHNDLFRATVARTTRQVLMPLGFGFNAGEMALSSFDDSIVRIVNALAQDRNIAQIALGFDVDSIGVERFIRDRRLECGGHQDETYSQVVERLFAEVQPQCRT